MEVIKNISPRSRVANHVDGVGLTDFNTAFPNGQNRIEERPSLLDVEPLSPTFLYSNRVIAFDSSNSMTHAYDVLRNHLLNGKTEPDERVISVSAPSTGCGTTVTAVNLAISLARVPGSTVLLVDVNCRDPGVGKILGLPQEPSFYDPIKGWLTTTDIRGIRVHLLRAAWGSAKIPLPADLERMAAQIEVARQLLRPTVVLFDLPPMLNSDEVIPFLHMSDTTVIVLAVGKSKLTDLEICRSYLGTEKRTQVVLNKMRRHGL